MKYRIRTDTATLEKLSQRDSIPLEVIPLLKSVPVVMTKENAMVVRVVFRGKRAMFSIAADCVEPVTI